MILVVSGARDGSRNDDVLEYLRKQGTVEWAVTGGANGVDRMVRFHGEKEGWRVIELLAPWRKYELAAGPIRNSWMLDLAVQLSIVPGDLREYHETILCVAFPGPNSRGTHRFIEEVKRRKLKLEVL